LLAGLSVLVLASDSDQLIGHSRQLVCGSGTSWRRWLNLSC